MRLIIISLLLLIQHLIMFLSSKKISLLVTAFQEVQNSHTVKRGEELLKLLRQQKDYQLGLATFLTRSKDCNERLLAITELQKILVLKEEQSVWLLKEVYYKDVERVSRNVRKIVSYVKNIKLARQFLSFNFQQVGFVQSMRYLQFVFSILKTPERMQETLYYHFQALLQGSVSMIEVTQQSEQCLFINLVCIAMLYQGSLQKDFQAHHERLTEIWKKIKQRCKFFKTNAISIVMLIVDSMLGFQASNAESDSLSNFFNEIFKCLSSKQNPLTKYYAKLLFLASKNLNIFASVSSILGFIGAFYQYNTNQIQKIIIETSFNTAIDLNNYIQKELEGQQQSLVRESLSFYIKEIFTQHYHKVTREYGKTLETTHPLFYFLIPLLNFYNSANFEPINQWIANNLQNVIDSLGKSINMLKNQPDNKQIIKDCVMYIQFLIKYKTQIPISLVVHICHIMLQVSAANSTLSPFCFNFIQHTWQDLAFLNFQQLSDFMLEHLTKLNLNQWDHKLQYFSCFLNLSKCLQQQYNYYSHFLTDEKLLQQSMKACQIIVCLLEQTPHSKIDHQLVILLIQLISSLIKGIQINSYFQFHRDFNIPFVRVIIQSLKIYSIQSADIIILDLFVRNKLPISLHRQFQIELSQLKDVQFKISLFLKQRIYLQQKLSIEAFHYQKATLFRQLYLFLQSIGKEKVNWLNESKLWPHIQEIRQQWNVPAIENRPHNNHYFD